MILVAYYTPQSTQHSTKKLKSIVLKNEALTMKTMNETLPITKLLGQWPQNHIGIPREWVRTSKCGIQLSCKQSKTCTQNCGKSEFK